MTGKTLVFYVNYYFLRINKNEACDSFIFEVAYFATNCLDFFEQNSCFNMMRIRELVKHRKL